MTDSRLPVLIVSGCLGSGKTTLLRQAVEGGDLRRTLIVVNEFSGRGVDDKLLESTGEPVVLLKNGCLCCTVNDDLNRSLLAIVENDELMGSVERIVIETTGLADPAPVFSTISNSPRLSARVRVQATITLVDAIHAPAQMQESPEFALQVQAADWVLVTKLDLAEAQSLDSIRLLVEVLNPVAKTQSADLGVLRDLLQANTSERADQIARRWKVRAASRESAPSGRPHLRSHFAHTDSDVKSFCVDFDEQVDWVVFSVWLSLMLHTHGDRLLRIKGFIAAGASDAPIVINCVRHVVHFPEHLKAWPSEQRTSYLVFIVRGLDPDVILRSLRAFACTRPSIMHAPALSLEETT